MQTVGSLLGCPPVTAGIKSHAARTPVLFQGIKLPEAESFFVFDLDGTFAEGSGQPDILERVGEKNGRLIYATGRTAKEFFALQAKLKGRGIELPTPQYLITNNGQFVYQNQQGSLVEDMAWKQRLLARTGFERQRVYDAMRALAHQERYLLDRTPYQDIVDFELLQESDPHFWQSKISYYEWNASPFMVEYFVASDVDIEELQGEISEALKLDGITSKFILNRYSKPIMDACSPQIRRQTQPVREDASGVVTALFLCPADKADAVEYLREKHEVPYEEIVLAGNDTNDISLAKLAGKGASFIRVGNAHPLLIACVEALQKSHPERLVTSLRHGTEGILEGLQTLLGAFEKPAQ